MLCYFTISVMAVVIVRLYISNKILREDIDVLYDELNDWHRGHHGKPTAEQPNHKEHQ